MENIITNYNRFQRQLLNCKAQENKIETIIRYCLHTKNPPTVLKYQKQQLNTVREKTRTILLQLAHIEKSTIPQHSCM